MNTYLFLQEDYDALVESVRAAERRRDEAMASIGEVIEVTSGTWHDNPAFDAAQDDSKRWTVEARKRREMLADAQVVPVTDQTSYVAIGSRVEFRFGGAVDEVIIGSYLNIGPRKDDDRVASNGSPLARALLDHKVGDTVIAELPGRDLSVTIVSLSL